MRVFLRHNRTGHYYNGDNVWVVEASDATSLGSIERALEVVGKERLDGMSLLIRYDDSGAEQVFDLTQEGPVRKPTPKT